jgi:uncharacterized delta-60 repeat protein
MQTRKKRVGYGLIGLVAALLVTQAPVLATIVKEALTLDATFGDNGRVITKKDPYQHERAEAVAVQPDGKLVVVGTSSSVGGCEPMLARVILIRYLADGQLDEGFGNQGIVETSAFDNSVRAKAVALQCDGKILVSAYGHSRATASDDFILLRYNSDGSLDDGFGQGGITEADFNGQSDMAVDVLVQADGKLVQTGQSAAVPGQRCFAVARYHRDGSLDRSFGEGGKVLTRFGDQGPIYQAAAIDRLGKIVVLGDTTDSDIAMARYDWNGSPDVSFGLAGKVITHLPGFISESHVIEILEDGRIVVAGMAASEEAMNKEELEEEDVYMFLARYGADGLIDRAFGRLGFQVTDMDGFDVPMNIHQLPFGKLLVSAQLLSMDGSRNEFALARYDAWGNLDPTFGDGGYARIDYATGTFQEAAFAEKLRDDTFIVGGETNAQGYAGFFVVRYRLR